MMAWTSSNRRASLPKGWARLRLIVMERDGYRCVWVEDGVRCPQPAREVDHINRLGGDDPSNLRSLCHAHHAKHTAQQSTAARPRRARLPELHPGLKRKDNP